MKLSRNEIIEKLKEILREDIGCDESVLENCTENDRLVEDFDISSVDMLYIVMSVEETFGIRFESVGIADFVTLKDVVDYVEARL